MFQMDAVTCKLFASLCLWTYIFIECSNGVPFHGFLTSADKFSRDIGEEEMDENEQRIREEGRVVMKKTSALCSCLFNKYCSLLLIYNIVYTYGYLVLYLTIFQTIYCETA